MSAVVSDTGAAIHSAAESESAPTLLQHFDLLATAPGGVAKLRELILTEKCVKPRPEGRGRKARSPLGLLNPPPVNQRP